MSKSVKRNSESSVSKKEHTRTRKLKRGGRVGKSTNWITLDSSVA